MIIAACCCDATAASWASSLARVGSVGTPAGVEPPKPPATPGWTAGGARGVVEQRGGERGGVVRLRHHVFDLFEHLDEAEDVVLVDVAQHDPAKGHRLVAAPQLLQAGLERRLPDPLGSPVDHGVARVGRRAVVEDQRVAVQCPQRFELEHGLPPSLLARRDKRVEAGPPPVVDVVVGGQGAPAVKHVGGDAGEHPRVMKQRGGRARRALARAVRASWRPSRSARPGRPTNPSHSALGASAAAIVSSSAAASRALVAMSSAPFEKLDAIS